MLFATVPSLKKDKEEDGDKKEAAKFEKMTDAQKLDFLYG